MEEFISVSVDLLNGFASTFLLFAFTLIFALPLGLLLSFGTMSKFAPVRVFFKLIVWILRGTPLLLQIFVVFYVPGLLFGFVWPTMHTGWDWFDSTISTRFLATLVAFIINYAAYFSEIYRGGIESMPAGQYEAAAVLGYTKTQTFCKIIMPQVFKRILPSVTNEVITLVKDTSLAYVVSVMEMFTLAKKIASSQTTLMPFVIAGVFYYIFNLVVAVIMERMERKLSYYR